MDLVYEVCGIEIALAVAKMAKALLVFQYFQEKSSTLDDFQVIKMYICLDL